ncbi:MAG: hypothetical protein B6U85_03130 [Desulfurococcales archaeon ex4484_42]|nr:MAG: hypothetical protein B6U85_03130 [Desulfurococcales archaeon ex4484_42]
MCNILLGWLGLVKVPSISVKLPRSIVERIERDAKRAGLSLEEYIIELIFQCLDLDERILEYVDVAKDLLEQAREELQKGDIRQAAEKVWGAAALTVKAYAEWRERRRSASHGELWEYMRRMVKELGPWVREVWMYANGMHTCFYEGWCGREDVEEALERAKKLVIEVERKVKSTKS